MTIDNILDICSPEPTTGCWLWTRAATPGGYGQLVVNGSVVYAHRLAFELAHGAIPAGHEICHKCDTPSCANPAHLFSATSVGNQRDKVKKGRQAKGSRQGLAKLNEDKVRQILLRRSSGERECVLAAEFGVSQASISDICNGNTWRHVTP